MKNNKEELVQMQEMLTELEENIESVREFSTQLTDMIKRKETLQKFYGKKWMKYYEKYEDDTNEFSHLLNQDSLWNALSDMDIEIRRLIQITAKAL